jgi:serine/threonine-protein kinase
MATVHLGLRVGQGFTRVVALKRLRADLARDPSFVRMFVDEARFASRIRHPNVVPTFDVVQQDGELLLAMEYVRGASLTELWAAERGRIPLSITVAIVSEILHGLHAAHEARSTTGEPLGIVHRDVSPQNVLVGVDGVTRVFDFGVAKSQEHARTMTTPGVLKGKLSYTTPEQLKQQKVTRRSDVYAAGTVLWELLTGERLFAADTPATTARLVLAGLVEPPSAFNPEVPPELDAIVLRALAARPGDRFATAREMALALESVVPRALGTEVGAWVEAVAADRLYARAGLEASIERCAVENVVDDFVFMPTVLAAPVSLRLQGTRWADAALGFGGAMVAAIVFALLVTFARQ